MHRLLLRCHGAARIRVRLQYIFAGMASITLAYLLFYFLVLQHYVIFDVNIVTIIKIIHIHTMTVRRDI
jgi:hypothetical protein